MKIEFEHSSIIPTGIYSSMHNKQAKKTTFQMFGVDIKLYKMTPTVFNDAMNNRAFHKDTTITAVFNDYNDYVRFSEDVLKEKDKMFNIIKNDKTHLFKTRFPKAQILNIDQTPLVGLEGEYETINEKQFLKVELSGKNKDMNFSLMPINNRFFYRVSVIDDTCKLKEYDVYDMFKESGVFYVSSHGHKRLTMYTEDIDDYSMELMKLMGLRYQLTIIENTKSLSNRSIIVSNVINKHRDVLK